MSYNNNYFLNNAGAAEKIRGIEAWIVWQKLNNANELVETTTAARNAYLDELKKAVDWAEKNGRISLSTTLNGEMKKVRRMNAVSFVLFY